MCAHMCAFCLLVCLKVKRYIYREQVISELQGITCHFGSTQCYL